ncbi:4a-hydroxytetrahydrobiopterin dehydratase [Rhodohalobacter mucosus]|uniref:Putative pterin-4-alpha-carbinolamine dehydratase n=1 Tax=Rhodohalobacter mucosus TaxID=2079485 RepID=A0A316TQC8_9BACT|nr:4a-hydroxytetrahydrobiopterin dehydratase [Rhodohalobacter mucosus]PWN06823.1 4a-hydroxytetrahydrobiopterin dehydratase [Rhodohalobacter mucosus]
MNTLTRDEIDRELKELNGWEFSNDKIHRELTFGDFRQALSFMVRVGFEAEELVHHPEWRNVYNTVNISLSTHDAGDKVTSKDINLAKAIDKIYKTY